jgi:hypothetical protein
LGDIEDTQYEFHLSSAAANRDSLLTWLSFFHPRNSCPMNVTEAKLVNVSPTAAPAENV